MRRWTVLMAAALLTVFVGCGTASVDEKVNIQTELTPAAGEMPAAEFLLPQNESHADGTEGGAPADTGTMGFVSAGDGTMDAGATGEGTADTDAAGESMTGTGAAGEGTAGTGAAGEGTAGTGAGTGTAGKDRKDADTTENAGNTGNLDLSAMASQVFELVNAQRSGAGLTVLRWDDSLAEAAQTRAGELAVTFSHTRPDGSRGADITGVSLCGENLASTEGSLSTAENVAAKWTKSGAHSENILCAGYTKAGAALYQASDGTVYWVVLFTGE